MKITSFFFIALSAINISSCHQESDSDENNSYSINNDEADLSNRLDTSNRGKTYAIISESANLTTKANDLSLTLVADLEAPTLEGETLQSTDILLSGNQLYVSYNTAGAIKRGGITSIALNGETDLTVTSEILFKTRDVNGIDQQGNSLYFTGSWEQELLSYASQMTLQSNRFTDQINDLGLEGYAGNDILQQGNQLYISTGDNSGLHVIDLDSFSETTQTDITDLRSLALSPGNEILWALSGQDGTLHHIDQGGSITKSYDIGGAQQPEAKSHLVIDKKMIVSAVGDGGVKINCTLDGSELATISLPTVEGIDSANITSNSAAVFQDYIFVAQGEAGVFVYQFEKQNQDECSPLNIEEIGSINFGSNLSANHIFYRSGYLFVANGLGGVKIISLKKT